MNNIEILEDYIEALRKPKPFKYTNEQKAQAIENLIKENKELKDKVEYEKELRIKYQRRYDLVKENNILKSKVKELGEQVHSKLDNNAITRGYQIIIDEMFSKLLEEGE